MASEIINMMMDPIAPLASRDLALAEQDLASWILSDDMIQGFHHGAKEPHFPPPEVTGHASPDYIISQGSPSDIDFGSTLDMNLSNIDLCFSDDFKKQTMFDELPSSDLDMESFQTYQNDTDLVNLMIEPSENNLYRSPQQDSTQDQVCLPIAENSMDILQGTLSESVYMQEEEYSPISYAETLNSPVVSRDQLSCEFPEEVKPSLFNGQEEVSTSFDEISCNTDEGAIGISSEERPSINGQKVISVRIADALVEYEKPVRKYNISPVYFATEKIQHSLKIPQSGNQKPKTVLINLMRVTCPVKQEQQSVEEVQETKPTLKEILASDRADELLQEIVAPVQPQTTKEEIVYVTDVEDDSGYHTSTMLVSPANDCFESCSSYENDIDADEHLPTPRRKAPYSLTERKLRKKEQNKRAALRYRQKKKEEEGSAVTSLEQLKTDNIKLNIKSSAMQSEVALMKKLMADVILSKVLKNK